MTFLLKNRVVKRIKYFCNLMIFGFRNQNETVKSVSIDVRITTTVKQIQLIS